MMAEQYPFADLSLARRLEFAEAQASVDFIEARAKAYPEVGAMWKEIAGTYAMFDGRASPITQTFGMGMIQPLTGTELDEIEQFFLSRGSPVFHEVTPLADCTVLSLLNERSYQPIEFTSVLYRPLKDDSLLPVSTNRNISVRLAGLNEQDLWAEVGFQGWSEFSELEDFLKQMGRVNAKRNNGLPFVAELRGEPIATALMSICEGVALLAGASTIPARRKQGAQLALLEARLRHAIESGCDIAMMCANPGSASQRNAERHGFHIAYTRIKWQARNGLAIAN